MLFDASAQGLLVDTSALAAVALVAYLFGRRTRSKPVASADGQLQTELARAQRLAGEMEHVASRAGVETTAHRRSVAAFQSQLTDMQTGALAADWQKLRQCADALLGPTLTLITDLTIAVDQLREQHARLIRYSASRIDRATRLQNRRSLDEQLEAYFSIHAAGKRRFALALFSMTPAGDQGPETGDDRLGAAARLLEECIRDDDFVARYSEDEFVVLMPYTPLSGALAFGERLLIRAESDLGCAMWGGVVEAASDESPEKLLSRADSALYSARASGSSCVFQHNGLGVRRHAAAGPAAESADDRRPCEELAGATP
jgi:diguanylate cyclase (GGDEF)-like protein